MKKAKLDFLDFSKFFFHSYEIVIYYHVGLNGMGLLGRCVLCIFSVITHTFFPSKMTKVGLGAGEGVSVHFLHQSVKSTFAWSKGCKWHREAHVTSAEATQSQTNKPVVQDECLAGLRTC